MKKFLLMISLVMIVVFSANPSAHAMTDSQKEACNKWIHGAAATAAGSAAVMAQAPGSDNVPFMVIMGGLTLKLASVFDIHLDEGTSKQFAVGMLHSFAAMFAARLASQFFLGWIPALGNSLNAATAAGLVELAGWEIANFFDTGNLTVVDKIAESMDDPKEAEAFRERLTREFKKK